MKGIFNKEKIGKEERTNRDLNMGVVLGMLAILIILIAALPVRNGDRNVVDHQLDP